MFREDEVGVPVFPVQRGQDGVIHPVKDLALIQKLDLGLCRVDVYVHGVGLELKLQRTAGELPHHLLVLIGPL